MEFFQIRCIWISPGRKNTFLARCRLVVYIMNIVVADQQYELFFSDRAIAISDRKAEDPLPANDPELDHRYNFPQSFFHNPKLCKALFVRAFFREFFAREKTLY